MVLALFGFLLFYLWTWCLALLVAEKMWETQRKCGLFCRENVVFGSVWVYLSFYCFLRDFTVLFVDLVFGFVWLFKNGKRKENVACFAEKMWCLVLFGFLQFSLGFYYFICGLGVWLCLVTEKIQEM